MAAAGGSAAFGITPMDSRVKGIFAWSGGRVPIMFPVDIARPRKLAVKRDPRFLQLEDFVWNLIEDEVKKTMLADRSSRGGAASAADSGI
jgi:hypothetical protein